METAHSQMAMILLQNAKTLHLCYLIIYSMVSGEITSSNFMSNLAESWIYSVFILRPQGRVRKVGIKVQFRRLILITFGAWNSSERRIFALSWCTNPV